MWVLWVPIGTTISAAFDLAQSRVISSHPSLVPSYVFFFFFFIDVNVLKKVDIDGKANARMNMMTLIFMLFSEAIKIVYEKDPACIGSFYIPSSS